MSLGRGRRVRAALASAPVTADRVRSANCVLQPVEHLGDDLARRRLGGLGEHLVELDEHAHEVHIGLELRQELRFQQQLGEIEPLDGVTLEHLHHGHREVAADVAEPSRHRRSRTSEPADPT